MWNRSIAWRCFIASAIAVIAHDTLNPHSAGGLLAAPLPPLSPGQWLRQLPLLAGVSAGGGLLGAAFNHLRAAVRPWRANPKQHAARVREVAVMAALTVSVIAALAAAVGRCLPVPAAWEAASKHKEPAWVQHTCAEGAYNDLATLWLAPSSESPALGCGVPACHAWTRQPPACPDGLPHCRPSATCLFPHIHSPAAAWSIRSLITLGTPLEPVTDSLASEPPPPYYSPTTLVALCLCYLPLMALSAALAIPGGLFMPSLLMGGSFGAACGLGLRAAGWHVRPGLFALCAATATLGGVFRSSISVVVLVTESCGELRMRC